MNRLRQLAFTTDYVDYTERTFLQGNIIKLARQFSIRVIREIRGEKLVVSGGKGNSISLYCFYHESHDSHCR